jgi:pilus assembly protein CpaD
MMNKRILALAALAMSPSLAACGGVPTNRTLNSIHQPVVERTNYTLDLATGNGGLPYSEQERLAGWFAQLGLRYGDRIALSDPLQSPATHASVEALAQQYSLSITDEIPTSVGFVEAGTTRVVVTRSKAVVHGCPDWSAHSDANPGNALSRNYGCATNSNLAAMVANPEHLLKGDGSTGDTVTMSSNKAIGAYRTKAPTGAQELKQTASTGQ